MYVVVRTAGDPLASAATVRRALAQVDAEQPISDVRSMDARIGRSLAGRRFHMVVLAVFASLALTLAAIGIYGIVAYAVTERTHEIGVGRPLGGPPRRVLGLIMFQGMAMTLGGTAIGIAVALAATRVMASLLFGVSAVDPVTFTTIPLMLAAVAFLACYIPARRATRVDPLIALRTE
jgi:putative ABC transport system permease protein